MNDRPPRLRRDRGRKPAAGQAALVALLRATNATWPDITADALEAGSAWERARVYLGLCERYQELYQAQVARLHLLMATVPAPGDPRPAGWVLRDTGAACPFAPSPANRSPAKMPPAAEPVQATACPASTGWTRRMH